MSRLSKIFCGITLLTVPAIAYGGFFLLKLLAGWDESNFTSFQQSMFRAGHAHAGVLVIFSLVAQLLTDNSSLPGSFNLCIRIGFPLSAILISAGFFLSAIGTGITAPNKLITVLYVGIGVFITSTIVLGIGLLKRRPS
jgi:hypothetical protein